jgi:nucleoside phosphorylase
MADSNNYISGSTFSGNNVAIGTQGSVVQHSTELAREAAPPGGAGELTVAVLVALDEEFRHFHTVLGRGSVVRPGRAGPANHVRLLEWPGARPVVLVSRVIGRKGAEHASVAAAQLIADCNPGVLVSIGISGAISADLSIGDLVVGDTTTGYLANTKVLDAKAAGRYEFVPAGDPYRADKWLCDRAVGMEAEAPEIYRRWRQGAIAMRRRSVPPPDAAMIKVVRGNLAAGPAVVSSAAFKQWMLAHKRDYLAVDMETAGVATAVWSSNDAGVRLLMIRGISDAADRDKSRLDADSGGGIREAAMKCATLYLEAVLHHVAASASSA